MPRRRRYTPEKIDATTQRPAGEGSWEAILARDIIGRVQHRYTGGGRRKGWEATMTTLIRRSHRG